MKKLPIGIQTFADIRDKKENYIYVDKTDIAFDLIDRGKYYFLSRPRRFGKSLFMDTLHNIFEGNKEYFEGLAIYDKWDWETKYPVIKIAFGNVGSVEELLRSIFDKLEQNEERLDLKCKSIEDYAICFADLIKNAYEKHNQKVVILIDEYDKPILDNIIEPRLALKCRDILRRLYSEIKNADQYVKFVMLTGVSKFSKASIFSGLNMLQDISLDKKYGNICGYTQKDIESVFTEHLKGVDLAKLKEWYNGYNFLKDDVYNPFDILLFISNSFLYKNYWFETGTPKFLIDLIKQEHYFLPNLSNLVVSDKLLNSFDIENLDLEVILYQTGYLTIDEMLIDEDDDIIEYRLKLPNIEVKRSFNDYIIYQLLGESNSNTKSRPIRKALKTASLEDLKIALISMFASIPYNNYSSNNIKHYEGFYASVIYIYLQSLGLEIIGEDVTNKGRIDLAVFIEDIIYIIEFKVGKEDALQQIKDRSYAQKYLDHQKEIYLVGINFDEDERNIVGFEYEKIAVDG